MKKSESILVVDIGNTSTSLGIFRNDRVTNVGRIDKKEQDETSIRSAMRKTSDGLAITGVCIASVVPAQNRMWQDASLSLFDVIPLMLSHRLELGMPLTYPKPESIGADRLANAVGGRIKYGAPLIVADFGTAVTFDVVSVKEGYVGGIIAPGMPLMFDYLADRTAQLPRISWSPVKQRVGKTTENAMKLGAEWGYRGMVREILAELMLSPSLKKAKVIATGGFASRVVKGLKPRPIVDHTLTLFGIGSIYGLNS